jgi:hypothetical protein
VLGAPCAADRRFYCFVSPGTEQTSFGVAMVLLLAGLYLPLNCKKDGVQESSVVRQDNKLKRVIRQELVPDWAKTEIGLDMDLYAMVFGYRVWGRHSRSILRFQRPGPQERAKTCCLGLRNRGERTSRTGTNVAKSG